MGNAKKEDAVKDKKTPNSIRNEQQKAKSRVAAKTRRKNENENIEQLTKLVPWIPDNPPDKSTIIRLTTSYIGLMKVFNGSRNGQMIGNGCSATKGVENLSLEVMDGFVIILCRDGTITFVNDKVVNYLGFPPHELMGKKIYNFVLRKDWDLVAKKLRGPLPCMDNPNIKEPRDDPDDVICEPDASELFTSYFENATWNDKIQFTVRMQCHLIRRTTSTKSTSFQIVRFTGRMNADGFFMGTGEYAWSPDLGDLPVYEPAFISRLSPDLKLLYCEGRIHRYMDSEAKDIVGRVVYPFYYPTDMFHIQKMHSKLLAEGKVTTVPYRWMNKDGGWVWLQSTTTRIQDEKTGRTYMLCVNYVLSAIENKGVVVGVNPETNEKVIEKHNEKENENDSDDAYLVDALTEALTRSNPFGQPTYPTGAIEGGQGDVPNVFNNNFSRNEPRYVPSFTSQESKAKPLEEFYTQPPHQNDTTMREQSDKHFEQISWPQGEHARHVEERRLPPQSECNGLHSTQHLEQYLFDDLIVNGQFSSDFLPLDGNLASQGEPVSNPGNISDLEQAEAQQMRYMEEQYKRNCLEESFKQQSHRFAPPPGHVKVEPEDMTVPDDTYDTMEDSFCLPDLSYFPNDEEINQEDIAYKASLYLFMNDEVPMNEPKFSEKPISQQNKPSAMLYTNHQRPSNGFTHGIFVNNQEQLYSNFSQVNHNNNTLPNDIMNLGNTLNGLAEEACIRDFDPTLLSQ